MLTNKLHTRAVRPNLELIGCSGAKGIRRTEQNAFSFPGKLTGQLADGCGLAHAVDADHQHDRRLGVEIQSGITNLQHLHKNIF